MDGISVRSQPIDQNATAYVLEVCGYIDTNTSSALERELEIHVEQGHRQLFLDLSTVDYISSAGWGVFISVIRQIRELGGELRLVGMQPDVREVFELLEFQSILDAYPSLDEALSALPSA